MISHQHKCIFIHIPKTAGQSIEHVFLHLLGLKWETRAPLLLRHNDRPELGPPSLAHLKADEYVHLRYLSQDLFDQYFKFAFVRNPWSRLVSIYKYLGFSDKVDFKSFLFGDFKDNIFSEKHWLVRPQTDFIYSENGSLLIDYVGRFENLQEDFDLIAKKIGMPSSELPHINDSKPSNTPHRSKARKIVKEVFFSRGSKAIPSYVRWQDYYDNESVDLVTRLYERDIDLLGYAI